MSADDTTPEDQQDEALTEEDLKSVAGGLGAPGGGAVGEAIMDGPGEAWVGEAG